MGSERNETYHIQLSRYVLPHPFIGYKYVVSYEIGGPALPKSRHTFEVATLEEMLNLMVSLWSDSDD